MAVSVSIALCTYNGARFIAEQIESILGQSRRPDEIVLSDDGSKDDTVAIAASMLSSGGLPFRILRRRAPLGVTANFERAITATTGELIALSDQDDIWHPDRLSIDVDVFEADPGLLLLHDDARLVDAAGDPIGTSLFESLSVHRGEWEAMDRGRAFAVYLRRNLITGAATVFRRSLLDAALPFPELWVHDEWLGIVAASRNGARAGRREAIDYRQHSQNQIGVAQPTWRYRLGRMLEPRNDRYERLAERSAVLHERLLAGHAAAEWVRLARRKAHFERARARYPRSRFARIGPVLSHWVRGDYRALSSQQSVDVLRDILQPAGDGGLQSEVALD